MSDYQFSRKVAEKYINKMQNAHSRGIAFKLTLQGMTNLMRAKRCYYTGVVLTEPRSGQPLRATDRTIDRIDGSKGYIPGNVVACCNAANHLKSLCESGGLAGYEMGLKILSKTVKRIKEK